MEILARFTHDNLNHAQENHPHLVVTLRAPHLDWVQKRPPIAIIPCVDLSGSMKGDKLKYAKQSVKKLIEHLAVGDVAGLVTFDDRAVVVVEPDKITGDFKAKLLDAVDRLHIGGGTNLADGLIQAVKKIQGLDLPQSFLHRVIMFTDGQPTMGITNPKSILGLLKKAQARATVSAFGYGAGTDTWGGLDQDFLIKLASQGKGNFAYVQDPDGALAAFGKELGGLLSTYATSLTVELEAINGRVGKVVTNVEYEEDVTGLVDIDFPDILGEEERHFVFRCDIPEQKKAFPRKTTIFKVRCNYTVLSEDGTKAIRKVETAAQLQFVRKSDAQAEPHKVVDAIVALHQTIRAQLEAEEKAKEGNYTEASAYMNKLQVQIAARGHDQIAAFAGSTSDKLATNESYVANAAYFTSAVSAGTRGVGTPSLEPEAASFLEGAGVVLTNSAMAHMGNAFSADIVADPDLKVTSGGIVIPSSTTITTTGGK